MQRHHLFGGGGGSAVGAGLIKERQVERPDELLQSSQIDGGERLILLIRGRLQTSFQ